MRERKALEEEFPGLITPDSPTQRVGATPADLFKPVKHRVRMLSLDNVFSQEELEAWGKRVERTIGAGARYVCELTISGVAVALTYENGVYTTGPTPSHGEVRADITAELRTSPA